jgi:hypothetical protein
LAAGAKRDATTVTSSPRPQPDPGEGLAEDLVQQLITGTDELAEHRNQLCWPLWLTG